MTTRSTTPTYAAPASGGAGRRTTYLDHAATTPVLPHVTDIVAQAMGELGNPSSLHGSGRAARRRVEEARETIADSVGARPSDVVFTAGGTEADNLAVKGLLWARQREDPRRRRIMVSAIEHHAVLDTVEWLERSGQAEPTWLPVDELGRVDLERTAETFAAHRDEIALLTVMWANNEVGTVQPVRELVELAAAYDVPVHTDAVQALGQIPLDFAASGVDAMTLSGHKVGGPFGVGALLVRREATLVPLLHGGGQERDVRSGTLDTPAIVGFAAAVADACGRQSQEAERLAALRDALVAAVRRQVPDTALNGDPGPSAQQRLPGNAHLSFPGCEGDSLLLLLDAYGIECSTGSACSAGVAEPSHVLLAMGRSEELARASLRFSLGHTSEPADVEALAEVIGMVVERARLAGLS